MRFALIDDDVPEETVSLLAQACAQRNVALDHVSAPAFDLAAFAPLGPGDLLYRPAVSIAAARVEKLAWRPEVATFYADPLGPFAVVEDYPLLFQSLGFPVPRSLPILGRDRGALRQALDAVGGLPAVIKVLGWSRGVGAIQVDSLSGLFSVVDLVQAQGLSPYLCAMAAPSVHWRVTVVGGAAAAAYRNPQDLDDFRTYGSEDPADFTDAVRADLADLAVRAVKALRLELGGVDILEHESGRLYLLEANFPCYFAQAQTVAGIDVAGRMVEHLISKSKRLSTG
jgi:hypothetical protein